MKIRNFAENFRSDRFKKHLGLWAIPVLSFFLVSGPGTLFAEEVPWTDKFMREFTEIKTRLEKIQKRQQEISEKQDKIQAELDRLRVWVRRR